MRRRRWLVVAAPAAALAYFGYRALSRWLTASLVQGIRSQPGFSPGPNALPNGTGYRSLPLAAASAQISGLDLIQRAASAQGLPPAPSAAQVEALRQAGLAMVDGIRPLLNDPRLTATMSPQQSAQYRQLVGILDQAEKAAKSGQPADLKRMALEVQKAQQLSLGLMGSLSQAPAQPQERK